MGPTIYSLGWSRYWQVIVVSLRNSLTDDQDQCLSAVLETLEPMLTVSGYSGGRSRVGGSDAGQGHRSATRPNADG